MSGYFGGTSVRTGMVRRLTASNFRELVDRYVHVPVQIPITRAEFWNMPDDNARDDYKDGPFVAACGFAYESEGPRNDNSATDLRLVIFDLDEGPWVKDFDESPDTLAEHLYPYSFVAWRTAKYRKSAPRLKVVVDVSPCDPRYHRPMVDFLADRLGIPREFKGARESKVLSQPQYRPVLFKGEDFEAVIASRLSGIPLSPSDLPLPSFDDEDSPEGRTFAAPVVDDDEFFGLSCLPVPDTTIEDVRSALFAIDPDCDYKRWIEVVAALRHQFTDEDDARAAYEMFVEWSEQGDKFRGRRDCWTKWKSFQPYAKGRPPVTIRTLYRHAIDSGWDHSKVSVKHCVSVEDWLAETDDRNTLISEGARRIAMVPFSSDVVEEVLLNAWKKRISAVGGGTIALATLRREVAKVRRNDRKVDFSAGQDKIPPWLRPMVFVGSEDLFVSLATGAEFKPAAFDRYYEKELLPKDDTPPTGRAEVTPATFALNIVQVQRVEYRSYDPTQNCEDRFFFDDETGRAMLNLYDPNSVPVGDPEYAREAEARFRQLIAPLVREAALQELLIDYCAFLVQHPGEKITWSFLIQSAQGAGKGTLTEVMEGVLGPVNVKVISSEMVRSGFNEWARNAVLGVFNEIYIPGDRRDQVMNSLKPLISDLTIPISIKHKDSQNRVRNTMNYLAFSNFKDACAMTDSERRWCVVFSPVQTREQVLSLQHVGHFDQVRWLLTPEGTAGLRYYLERRKFSDDFEPKGHAPDTPYRREVVASSKNPLQVAIEEAIEDAVDPLITKEVIHENRMCELVCRSPREQSLVHRYLAALGYERYTMNRVMVGSGPKSYLWVNYRHWQNGIAPQKFLEQRLLMSETPGFE